jgi:uncharacterized membrane protein YoaT (DUF817 family)
MRGANEMSYVRKLLQFIYQEAMSCLFPAAIFITLALSKIIAVPYVHRYDVILLVCLVVQYVMYRTGLETKDEVKVIAVFHLIGLGLELFKVHIGSWSYPESAWSKLGGVPLYSGFMYASVASYICQAWRRMHLRIENWPRAVWTMSLGTVIYLNFFTNHYVYDVRWIIMGLLVIVFWRTYVSFSLEEATYRMPLTLSFFLIGFFIWIAENIATFFGAWQYPNQKDGWQIVHVAKISSWFLLVVVSFIVVAQLKHVKEGLHNEGDKAVCKQDKKSQEREEPA